MKSGFILSLFLAPLVGAASLEHCEQGEEVSLLQSRATFEGQDALAKSNMERVMSLDDEKAHVQEGVFGLSWCPLKACKKTRHYNWGKQRIQRFPINQSFIEGPQVLKVNKDLIGGFRHVKVPEGISLERLFYYGRGQHKGDWIFYQVVRPTNTDPSAVVVLLHGYSQVGDSMLESAIQMAKDEGFVSIIPDAPSNGRSSGLLYHGTNWDSLNWAEHMLDEVVPPLTAVPDKMKKLKVFGMGASFGAGSLFRMGVTGSEPKSFKFSGHVLLEPFLLQDENMETLPKWLEMPLLKAGRFLFSEWPIAPMEDVVELSYRKPHFGRDLRKKTPFYFHPPRIGSSAFALSEYLPWVVENLPKYHTPFLTMHGKDDKVNSYLATRDFYKVARSKDKTFKLIEDAWHGEILHAHPDQPKHVQELPKKITRIAEQWIARRLEN